MTTTLWIISGVLAFVFTMAGAMKLMKSKAELAKNDAMGWVEDFSERQIKGIGAIEVLGGIGVIAPVAAGIAPILSPIAALGLVLTMVGAAATHMKRGELMPSVAINAVLGGLAAFVAVSGF